MNRRHFRVTCYHCRVVFEAEDPQELRAAIKHVEAMGVGLVPEGDGEAAETVQTTDSPAGDEAATCSVFWVDACSELPADDITVLVNLDDGEVWTGFMDDGIWRYVSADAIDAPVTHWANFPSPPNAQADL